MKITGNLSLGEVVLPQTKISGVTPLVNTFLGAPIDPTGALFVVVGVPYDGTSSFRQGSSEGPAAIREASQNIESFCLQEGASLDAEELPLADVGDVEVGQASVQTVLQRVEEAVRTLQDGKRTIIILGGEHSLTLGVLRGLSCDVTLVQFDAHMDLRDTYGGTPLSHACVMRRAAEHLGPDHLVQVGVRAVSREEYHYARTNNITYFTSQEVEKRGASALAAHLSSILPPQRPLYLSLDIDVLDPAFAPAASNPEAGGLTPNQLFTLIRAMAPRAVALDVTELAPQYDQGVTALCAARAIITFLCAKSAQPPK